jgi:hypothetical protein
MAIDKIQSESINLADNFDFTGNVTGAGETNKPTFYGELASSTTIARGQYIKVTGMTNDEVDSNSAFDGTTFTVPSGMNGTYYIYGAVQADYELVGDDGEETRALIYKNGSQIKESKFQKDPSAGDTRVRIATPQVSLTVNLSVGDTIELYCMVIDDNNSGTGRILENNTSIGGYKLF